MRIGKSDLSLFARQLRFSMMVAANVIGHHREEEPDHDYTSLIISGFTIGR
jgi:peroxiredoxin